MGFGGGGGGGMTNHVHNSVPLQGGPLDFANDTIASLNVGSAPPAISLRDDRGERDPIR